MRTRKKETGTIQYEGQEIRYEIAHRPRVTRRLHLELGEAGSLRVVAPPRMSRRSIRRALKESAPSVVRFLARARSRQEDIPELRYVSGEVHLFMGLLYPLKLSETAPRGKNGVFLSAGSIRLAIKGGEPERAKKKLAQWYRQQAQVCFTERLAHFAAQAPWTGGITPPMRLRLMKRTWGNCSVAGLITLNPHLIKAPPECIDYVIAHEICHLAEHNHGRGFYQLQEQLYPAWRAARALIRQQGHIYLHS